MSLNGEMSKQLLTWVGAPPLGTLPIKMNNRLILCQITIPVKHPSQQHPSLENTGLDRDRSERIHE